MLPKDMLQIKLETRAAIRESVSRAKAALIAKVNTQNDAEDMARLDASANADSAQGKRYSTCQTSEQADTPKRRGTASSARTATLDEINKEGGSKSRPTSFTSLQTFGSEMTLAESFPRSPPSPASAKTARSGQETWRTKCSDSHTFAVACGPTPPCSRGSTVNYEYRADAHIAAPIIAPVGSRHPSKENPFASFITERSDSVAEGLANDLMLCYFAHNQVQDKLRSIWRTKNKSTSAEQVTKEVWDQLPEREYEVSKEFEGQLGQRRALTMEQLIYVWVYQFWNRCKDEGW